MDFQLILGVDMSKDWFDYCLMNRSYEVLQHGQVVNQRPAIEAFLQTLTAQLAEQGIALDQVRLCLEHTGVYVKPLQQAWLGQGAALSMIPARHIPQALNGGQHWTEKTDAWDAQRIAEYGWRFADRLTVWQVQAQTLQRLQYFQRLRERLIKVINILQVPLQEAQGFDCPQLVEDVQQHQSQSLTALQQELAQVEKRLEQIIQADEHLQQLYEWICSVQGIGAVTAREVLIVTQGFTRFTPDQAKSFARYVGIAPTLKQSGQLRSKARLRSKGNQQLKKLLTMGARSIIPTQSELSQYYHRKVAEGKHPSCVINAVRNKLILRIFAVVRNQVIYQKNPHHSLVLP